MIKSKSFRLLVDLRVVRILSTPTPELRVEGVTQGISEQIEGKDKEHNGSSGIDGHVRGRQEEALSTRNHTAPRWEWRLHAKPEIAEPRLGENCSSKLRGGIDDN